MAYFAVVKAGIVDGIAIADSPLPVDGEWIDVTNADPMPAPGWSYVDGVFTAPPPVVPPELPPVKTEEQKLADAVAAAIAKLVADGVLKQ